MIVSEENSKLICCSISARLNLMPERLVCADDFTGNVFLQVKDDCCSALSGFYSVFCKNTEEQGFTVSLTVKPVLTFDRSLTDSLFYVTVSNSTFGQKQSERQHEAKSAKGFVRRTSSRFRNLSSGLFSRRCASFRL